MYRADGPSSSLISHPEPAQPRPCPWCPACPSAVSSGSFIIVFLTICAPHKNRSDLVHSPHLPAGFYKIKINKLEIKAFSSGHFKISLYLCSVPFLSFLTKTKKTKQTSPSSKLTLSLVNSLHSLLCLFFTNCTFSIHLYFASGPFSFAFKSVQLSLNK